MPGCVKSETMQEGEEDERVRMNQADMTDDSKENQKLTGYLEKKCKLKLINSWKRYWFVLKGNLLLYYGSKEEYDALSPVKGRITLGPTCNVKPYPSTPEKFQITSRSGNVITLKAESISEQNKWMKAIYSAVNENQKVEISPTKLNHFRYSTERIDALMKNTEQKKRSPSPISTDLRRSPTRRLERENSSLLERVQKMGGRSLCNSTYLNNQQKGNNSPIANQLNSELNERFSRSEQIAKESGRITPIMPKILEKPKPEKERVIIEDEDYCVCSLDKNDRKLDSPSVKTPQSTSSFKTNMAIRQNNTSSHGQNKNTIEEIHKTPQEKLRILREKLQVFEPTIEETNGGIHSEQAVGNEFRSVTSSIQQEKETAHHDKTSEIKDVNTIHEDQIYQNYAEICPNSPRMSANNQASFSKDEKKRNPSTNSETTSSYQDFRENELYAITNESSSPTKQEDKSSEKLYAELEEAQTPRGSPEFEFPPPPSEAYESALDLTTNSKHEDEDSLYEEAEEVTDEDFIWQNEIYASSENTRQDQLYAEPNFHKYIQQSFDGKERKSSSAEEEFDNDTDLYEVVDTDFTYRQGTRNNLDEKEPKSATTLERFKTVLYEEIDTDFSCPKSPTEEVNSSNISFRKHDFREVPQRPCSQVQFENDIYGTVNTQPRINSENTLKDEEQQFENDLYATAEKHSPEKSTLRCFKTEKEIKNLYTKPDNKSNGDRTISQTGASSSSTKEVKVKNDSYDKGLFHRSSSSDKKNLENTFFRKGNLEIENDLYAVPNERFYKDSSQKKDNYETPERVDKETEIENDLYAVPNEIFCRQNRDTNQRAKSLEKDLDMENDLYAVPNEVFCKDDIQTNNNWKNHDRICSWSKEIDNDLYAEPQPNYRHDTDKRDQIENAYSEPNFSPTEPPRKPIFSRQNSRTDTHSTDKLETNLSKSPDTSLLSSFLDKILHKKTKHDSTDEEHSVDLDNELYSQPHFNLGTQKETTLHEDSNSEEAGETHNLKYDLNVYEDPDQLMLRPHKTEEQNSTKKKLRKSDSSKSKCKDEKKQDTFILRLLKQATKKHGDKAEKSADLATRDESLALLAEFQVLLEKKKRDIREMVAASPKSNHRRFLSDSNAKPANIDQCGASSLKRSMSIDLNEEYSLVLDNIDDNDAIYSEVDMVNRNSKELTDLIDEILKRNKKCLPEQHRSASYAER